MVSGGRIRVLFALLFVTLSLTRNASAATLATIGEESDCRTYDGVDCLNCVGRVVGPNNCGWCESDATCHVVESAAFPFYSCATPHYSVCPSGNSSDSSSSTSGCDLLHSCSDCLEDSECAWDLVLNKCFESTNYSSGSPSQLWGDGVSSSCPVYCNGTSLVSDIGLGRTGSFGSGGVPGKLLSSSLDCIFRFETNEYTSLKFTVSAFNLTGDSHCSSSAEDFFAFSTSDGVNETHCGTNLTVGSTLLSRGSDITEFSFRSGSVSPGYGFFINWETVYDADELRPICSSLSGGSCDECTNTSFCGYCPSTGDCEPIGYKTDIFLPFSNGSVPICPNSSVIVEDKCSSISLVDSDTYCKSLGFDECKEAPNCGYCQEYALTEARCRLLSDSACSLGSCAFTFSTCAMDLVDPSPSSAAYFALVDGFSAIMTAPFKLTYSIRNSKGESLGSTYFSPPLVSFVDSYGNVSQSRGNIDLDATTEGSLVVSYAIWGSGLGNFSFVEGKYRGIGVSRYIINSFVRDQCVEQSNCAVAKIDNSLLFPPKFLKGYVSDDFASVRFESNAALFLDASVSISSSLFVSSAVSSYSIAFSDLDPLGIDFSLYVYGLDAYQMILGGSVSVSSVNPFRRKEDDRAMEYHVVSLIYPSNPLSPEVSVSTSSQVGDCSIVSISSSVVNGGPAPTYQWSVIDGFMTAELGNIFWSNGTNQELAKESTLEFSSEFLSSDSTYRFGLNVTGIAEKFSFVNVTIAKISDSIVTISLPPNGFVIPDPKFDSTISASVILPQCDGSVSSNLKVFYIWEISSSSSGLVSNSTSPVPEIRIGAGVLNRYENYTVTAFSCVEAGKCVSSSTFLTILPEISMNTVVYGSDFIPNSAESVKVRCGLVEDDSGDEVISDSISYYWKSDLYSLETSGEPSFAVVTWPESIIPEPDSILTVSCTTEYDGKNRTGSLKIRFYSDPSSPNCEVIISTKASYTKDTLSVSCSGLCDTENVEYDMKLTDGSGSLLLFASSESISHLMKLPSSSTQFYCTLSPPGISNTFLPLIASETYKPRAKDTPIPNGDGCTITPSSGNEISTVFTAKWPLFLSNSQQQFNEIVPINYILSIQDEKTAEEIPVCVSRLDRTCRFRLHRGAHSFILRATQGSFTTTLDCSGGITVTESPEAEILQLLEDKAITGTNLAQMVNALYDHGQPVTQVAEDIVTLLNDVNSGGPDNLKGISALKEYSEKNEEQEKKGGKKNLRSVMEDSSASIARGRIASVFANTLRSTNGSRGAFGSVMTRPDRVNPNRGVSGSDISRTLAIGILSQIGAVQQSISDSSSTPSNNETLAIQSDLATDMDTLLMTVLRSKSSYCTGSTEIFESESGSIFGTAVSSLPGVVLRASLSTLSSTETPSLEVKLPRSISSNYGYNSTCFYFSVFRADDESFYSSLSPPGSSTLNGTEGNATVVGPYFRILARKGSNDGSAGSGSSVDIESGGGDEYLTISIPNTSIPSGSSSIEFFSRLSFAVIPPNNTLVISSENPVSIITNDGTTTNTRGTGAFVLVDYLKTSVIPSDGDKSSTNEDGDSSALSTWEIVGIVLGSIGLMFLILLFSIVVLLAVTLVILLVLTAVSTPEILASLLVGSSGGMEEK